MERGRTAGGEGSRRNGGAGERCVRGKIGLWVMVLQGGRETLRKRTGIEEMERQRKRKMYVMKRRRRKRRRKVKV